MNYNQLFSSHCSTVIDQFFYGLRLKISMVDPDLGQEPNDFNMIRIILRENNISVKNVCRVQSFET